MNVLVRSVCLSARHFRKISGPNCCPSVHFFKPKLRFFFTSAMHSMDDDTFLFTSESVGEGHPDKICDQISDAVLDAHLAQDPDAKVACETVAKGGMILLCGEISSSAIVDVQAVVRRTLVEIGYNDPSVGLDAKICTVLTALQAQSPEIAQGVHKDRDILNVAAGDQGLMFGYATDETPSMMPTTLLLAHNINRYLAHMRKTQQFPWACPDTKSQVTCEYTNKNGSMVVKRVHTVVISAQHTNDVSVDFVRREIMEKLLPTVIPKQLLDSRTVVHVNPCGAWNTGGPAVDAGLTGRKLMVDTYGGWGAHGGGAFSGKDPTKVDRSAAYAARWVAKSLVAAGLCRRCLIQVSYAIAIPDPLSISVFHFGTAAPGLSQRDLEAIVKHNFDLRPGAIIRDLDLLRPIYFMTAKYGHFGDLAFPWELPKPLELPSTLQAVGYREKGLQKFKEAASPPSSTATLSSNE